LPPARAPFAGDFTIVPIPEQDARPCLGGKATNPLPETSYYAVLLTPRQADGGVLGLLWIREGGVWRMVADRMFAPQRNLRRQQAFTGRVSPAGIR
jgi:hypothetical protein